MVMSVSGSAVDGGGTWEKSHPSIVSWTMRGNVNLSGQGFDWHDPRFLELDEHKSAAIVGNDAQRRDVARNAGQFGAVTRISMLQVFLLWEATKFACAPFCSSHRNLNTHWQFALINRYLYIYIYTGASSVYFISMMVCTYWHGNLGTCFYMQAIYQLSICFSS